jgi:hypothetical protein
MQKKMKAQQAVDPAFASLLPGETRFQRASDVTRHISERYAHVLSSPTRGQLRQVKKVVTEAVHLSNTVTAYVDDRRARVEKVYNQKKPGKRGRPYGDFSKSLSLAQLREQRDKWEAEGPEKLMRAEQRHQRPFIIKEMNDIKASWRENKQGKTFQKWLVETQQDITYHSLDSSRAEITRILGNKTDDFFTIDTGHSSQVTASIEKAQYAPKPLNAVDWAILPEDDDDEDIDITMIQKPPGDEDEEEEEEEEVLEVIEISQVDETSQLPPWARSSPPRESPPAEVTTPCPGPPQRLQHLLGKARIFRKHREKTSSPSPLPREAQIDAGRV